MQKISRFFLFWISVLTKYKLLDIIDTRYCIDSQVCVVWMARSHAQKNSLKLKVIILYNLKDLYGADLEDRKRIFKNILSDEEFIDRRINISELIEPETESDNYENIEFFDKYNN